MTRIEAVTAEPGARDSGQATEVLGVRHLHKRFYERDVVNGVDLSITRGERVVIIGRSGSGKSTLLRCLNLLEIPTSGELRYEGEVIGSWSSPNRPRTEPSSGELRLHRTRVGMVFQHFELFPHLSAIGNVAVGLRRTRRQRRKQAIDTAARYLARVGLEHRMHAHPHELSGGEQQRVAIARSLAMEPAVILFDEPTSALDPELVDEVLEVMKKLAEDGMTMVVVTHEMTFARDIASWLVVLADGKIVEMGQPGDVIDHPETAATERLLRKLRFR